MQTLLVSLTVLIALLYLIRRVVQALRRPSCGCAGGCPGCGGAPCDRP